MAHKLRGSTPAPPFFQSIHCRNCCNHPQESIAYTHCPISEDHLLPSIHAQHWRTKSVGQSPLLVFLSLLPHVRSWPFNLAVLVITLAKIALTCTVVGRIDSFAIRVACVCTATMGQVGGEDQQLACTEQISQWSSNDFLHQSIAYPPQVPQASNSADRTNPARGNWYFCSPGCPCSGLHRRLPNRHFEGLKGPRSVESSDA